MNKFVLLFIAVFCMTSFGAQKTITNVYVNDNGFSMNINISELDSSGVYDFFWDNIGDTVLHIPTVNTPYIMVERMSYDSATCARDTLMEKVYIDTVMRRNYPNNLMDSAVVYASDSVVITCALERHIFVCDTIRAIFIPAGLYVVGANSNAEYTGAVTNNSNRTYSEIPCKTKWTRPDRDIYDDDFIVRMLGVHRSARDGNLLRAVIFTAEDNHSNVYSDTVWHTSIEDNEFTDTIKVEEYICTVSVASFVKGDSITVNFKALPYWGDSVWTGDGVNTAPSPLYCPQKYLYDQQYVAHVNEGTGDDGTGAVVWDSLYDPDSPPAKYSTIAGAISGIRAAVGDADILGGEVFVEAGDYTWYGGTITSGTKSSFNTTISNFRSDSVNITALSGSAQMPANSYMKAHGLHFVEATGNMLTLETQWWIDSVIWHTGTYLLLINNCNHATRCKYYQDVDIPLSTNNAPFAISRGNEYLSSDASLSTPYCVIGDYSRVLTSISYRFEYNGMTAPKPLGSIIAYCYFSKNGNIWDAYGDSSTTNGFAAIGNVIEVTTNTDKLQCIACGSGSDVVNAFEFYNNTFVGDKSDLAINNVDLTDNDHIRDLWVWRNNIWHLRAIIDDDDSHGGPASSTRQGNWGVIWGAETYGEYVINDIENMTKDFNGLRSSNPDLTYSDDGSITAYCGFVGDSCWTGSAAGNGDYHLQEGSPFIDFTDNQVLSFDMDGIARNSTLGAIGAYTGPNEGLSTYSIDTTWAGGFSAWTLDSITGIASGTVMHTSVTVYDSCQIVGNLYTGDFISADAVDSFTVTGDMSITVQAFTTPVIDSIRDSTALRDSTRLQAARSLDTINVYGYGFATLGAGTEFSLNSTGTVTGTVLACADTKMTVIIPAATPRGWYSSWVTTDDGAIGTPKSHALLIKDPGGS